MRSRRNPPSRERETERRRDMDPEDASAVIAAVAALARVEGPSAYTRFLNDRLVWNSIPPELQDHAILSVGESLGRSFGFEDTRVYECGGQRHRIGSFFHKKTGVVLHLLPGGQYMMGSYGNEPESDTNERLVHPVVIDPFLCGRVPVTIYEWTRSGGEYKPSFYFDDHWNPVSMIQAKDARAFVSAAGSGLRLLSESEWEYACRAGTTTRRFWGDDMDASYAWFQGNSGNFEHSVLEHWDAEKWNAFGLVDMIGNVWEYVEDSWRSDYRRMLPDSSQPLIDPRIVDLTIRGGSYSSPSRECRSASRGRFRWSASNVGFRVARSLNV